MPVLDPAPQEHIAGPRCLPGQRGVGIDGARRVGGRDEIGVLGDDRPRPCGRAEEQEPADWARGEPVAAVACQTQRVGLGSRPADLLLDPAQLRLCLARDDRPLGASVEHEIDDAADGSVDGHLRCPSPACMGDRDELPDHGSLQMVPDERTAAGVQAHAETTARGPWTDARAPRSVGSTSDCLDVLHRGWTDTSRSCHLAKAQTGIQPRCPQAPTPVTVSVWPHDISRRGARSVVWPGAVMRPIVAASSVRLDGTSPSLRSSDCCHFGPVTRRSDSMPQ